MYAAYPSLRPTQRQLEELRVKEEEETQRRWLELQQLQQLQQQMYQHQQPQPYLSQPYLPQPFHQPTPQQYQPQQYQQQLQPPQEQREEPKPSAPFADLEEFMAGLGVGGEEEKQKTEPGGPGAPPVQKPIAPPQHHFYSVQGSGSAQRQSQPERQKQQQLQYA